MIGTLRWNVIIGMIGMLLTVLFSVSNNMFLTSLLRGLYSFAILFAASFFLRWFLGTIIGMNEIDSYSDSEDDKYKGGNVDISTPDENEEINESLKSHLESPEDLVKAIRYMSED